MKEHGLLIGGPGQIGPETGDECPYRGTPMERDPVSRHPDKKGELELKCS